MSWKFLLKTTLVVGPKRRAVEELQTFSSISAAVRLVTSRFSTSSVSPRKFPEAEDRRDRRLSSSVFKVILKPFCSFVRSDWRKKRKTREREREKKQLQFGRSTIASDFCASLRAWATFKVWVKWEGCWRVPQKWNESICFASLFPGT